MHFSLKTGLALAALAVAAGPAAAGPIQYVFSGPVTGTLNGKAFTDTQITFIANGDTTGVVNTLYTNPTTLGNLVGSPTFTLAGVGSGTLTNSLGYSVFDAQGGVAGLGALAGPNKGGPDLFDEANPAFKTYDLATSLGPVTSTNSSGNPGHIFTTSLGNLVINSFGDGATFQATTSPVPEASSSVSLGVLLALGLGGLVIAAKRKKISA